MRLIDVDNYCENICICNREQCDKEKCSVFLAPTIDAVPVIRCKNCKHFSEFRAEAKKDGADGTCRLLIMKVVENEFSIVKATDFCSYGERRNDNA